MLKKTLNLVCCIAAVAAFGCGSSSTSSDVAGSEATSGEETAASTEAIAEAPAKTEAASTEAAEPPPPPKYGVAVMHVIPDYDKWKAVFDSNQQARKDAGVLAHVISVDAQRPNHVTVFALTNDIEKAKAFMGSPELKETMKAAGVKGKPEMVFLENVELAMAPPTAEQTSLPDVVQAIEVKDFDAWKTAFEAQSDARKAAGIAGYCIHRDVDAPSKVYVMYQAESHDVLKKYLNSPETKKAQKAAGVKGPSKVWYENDKEFVSYGN